MARTTGRKGALEKKSEQVPASKFSPHFDNMRSPRSRLVGSRLGPGLVAQPKGCWSRSGGNSGQWCICPKTVDNKIFRRLRCSRNEYPLLIRIYRVCCSGGSYEVTNTML